jgi:hypothetical protein
VIEEPQDITESSGHRRSIQERRGYADRLWCG